MRMWMVDPRILCRQHLLGEHVELHMFVGTINKNKNLDGYIKNNLLEIESIYTRHKELVDEMKMREYNHNSKLPFIDYPNISNKFKNNKIDVYNSLNELLNRCKECKKNYNNLKI